jgi:hypothetical protein
MKTKAKVDRWDAIFAEWKAKDLEEAKLGGVSMRNPFRQANSHNKTVFVQTGSDREEY